MFIAAVFISLVFSKHKAEKYFLQTLRIWSDGWMLLSGIRLKFIGYENYKPNVSYVMVSNHYSLLDMMTGASSVHPNSKILAKAEIKKVPFFSKLFAMSSVFVDRKSKESRDESKRLLTEAMNRGMSIYIFPEGTRNQTDKPLKEFYDGAFRMAIEQQKPVLPLTTTNSRFINRMDSVWLWPGTYEIHFLEPVETKGMTEEDIPALKQKIYDLMEASILKHDRWFSNPQNR